ncbi:hypothetical protein DIPPA_11283 [Diplonema papillatum]|nr:hypothetical protein DIPPA_11283 [Diplonema papillatum]
MTALSGAERKQAMDAIDATITSFLKAQEPDFEDASYRPDLVLVKGTKDWDLKGCSAALVETKSGKEKKFNLTGTLKSEGGYSKYALANPTFSWK